MPRKNINFELDFMKKDIFPRFTVKQFDDVSFNIKPKNQGLDYDTTGMTGKIFVGVNNDMFMQTTGITVSSNNIKVLLDKNMLQNRGRAYAEIELTDSNGTITSSSFIFNIDAKIGEGAKIPGEYEGFVKKYERLISEFKAQVNSTIDNCKTNINSTINNCNKAVDNKLNDVDNFIDNKILDIEKRFNTLTSSQQQDAEVIDARDGETSLKARLDRDIEKAKQVYVNVEGSNISTDSSSGYLKDVEIKGNTIQDASNLADIRSVGDKVEGQELYKIPVLSCGKNLYNGTVHIGKIWNIATVGTPLTDETLQNSSDCNATDIFCIKPSTKYIAHLDRETLSGNIKFYDKDKKYISQVYTLPTISPNNAYYCTIHYNNSTYGNGNAIQLEEGSVATEYEPYQEDKITILSPVQLEKVGDVADRIIEKDGVLGVEKNVITTILNGSRSWTLYGGNTSNTFAINFKFSDMKTDNVVICDKLQSNATCWEDKDNNIGIHSSSSQGLIIRLLKSYLDTVNVQGAKDWLQANLPTIKYPTTQPQFIPLPHDQQVKLRTFANKTNISFLTEIEGTIKAQVPKSLGATVNTHTEQINNLNKELDRVKKLEESTVSTVETESDFTTVEATSNGYFEDVKLEGKTLVNKFIFSHTETVTDSRHTIIAKDYRNITNIKVTIVNLSTKPIWVGTYNSSSDAFVKAHKIEANSSLLLDLIGIYLYNIIGYIADGWTSADELKPYALWVEGDHTQNPPSYFEGLKSVGQDVDEIVVSSVNENLFDKTQKLVDGYISEQPGTYGDVVSHNTCKSTDFILIEPNTTYTFNNDNPIEETCGFYDTTKKCITVVRGNKVTSPSNAKYMRCTIKRSDFEQGFQIVRGTQTTKYTPHQSDKKRLLFYNEETQTWEKPILREWDSIEKHSNGKYYYHQRSGEVVLNGSESDTAEMYSISDTTMQFNIRFDKHNLSSRVCINDKFLLKTDFTDTISEGIQMNSSGGGRIVIRILKSKLSTQDVQGFKQWLQTNNVTVVYQLAQEKVYECANIDLITYANETSYIVECGAIVPRTTLKVHNNISNVVSLLQKKVSLLESNITNYMITQNRMQLASTYSADSVTFKVDYALCSEEVEYNEDLYNLILNNILVGKDNYDYDKMFAMILDYASWNQISWEQFDILVGLMDMQHNPPVEDEIVEEIPNEIM